MIKKFLPRNDYVRNHDRQDPTTILKLCNSEMCDYISYLGYVCHTIVPETVRFTATDRVGAFPHITSIATGPAGWLLFLSYNAEKRTSKLYKAKLHNPVQVIELISGDIKGTRIYYFNGIIFITGNTRISFFGLETRNPVKQDVTSVRSLGQMKKVLEDLKLSVSGTLATCKDRVRKHQEQLQKRYEENNWDTREINFVGEEKMCFSCLTHVVPGKPSKN